MFIPLGTDRSNKRPTLVTFALIALNVIAFFGMEVLARTQPDTATRLHSMFALDPSDWKWWQFFSYQFMHGGLMHILGNMVFLLVFGPGVEDRLRRLGFLAFYLIGGAFAGLCHMFLGSEVVRGAGGVSMVIAANPVIGASGSISCVTGAFLVFFPLTNIRVIVWFFYIGSMAIPSWIFITMSVIKDLFMEGFGASQGVAHLAHLGGYFYGAVIGLLLLWTKVLPRETYDLLSIGKHAHRRRQFKELATAGKGSPWLADQAKAVRKDDSDKPDARSELAGQVLRHVSARELDLAADRYAELLTLDSGVSFPREVQLELANHCFATGRHAHAAAAYGVFLAKRPDDREAESVRLMMAILKGRYLGDAVRARELLSAVRVERLSGDEREAAEQLRTELTT